ncbi:MAG: DUF1573 domain-containing protein [Bacteroidia bacterium]
MKKIFVPMAILLFTSVTGINAQGPATTAPAAAVTPAPVNPNGPAFKFEEEEFNFGKITQGESVSHDFKFKNTGKEPLVIADATATCGCTKPSFAKDPIKPSGSGVISVTFNSTGKMGAMDKPITITSNAKDGVKIVHLKGEVMPKPAEGPADPSKATPTPVSPK